MPFCQAHYFFEAIQPQLTTIDALNTSEVKDFDFKQYNNLPPTNSISFANDLVCQPPSVVFHKANAVTYICVDRTESWDYGDTCV